MINQFIESVEIQKENEMLKTENNVLKNENHSLKYDVDNLKEELERLKTEHETDVEFYEDSVKYNLEALIEYLDSNGLLTDEIKNTIEFFAKFYIEI